MAAMCMACTGPETIWRRLGGRMFGETLRLARQSRAHFSGRIGGMVTGCRIEADVLGSAVAVWCARSFNLQHISIQTEDMDALMMQW